MSRLPIAAALFLLVALAACQPGTGAARPARSPRPALAATSPPAVRLRPAAEAILSDETVGAPRRAGEDHLTAEQAASEQPDQAAALSAYSGWAWLDGASRTWTTADEMLVITARPDRAARAFDQWSADAGSPCSAPAAADLDGCRLGVTGDRAVVVGRLGAAVFRLQCPAEAAERLAIAQAASLRA